MGDWIESILGASLSQTECEIEAFEAAIIVLITFLFPDALTLSYPCEGDVHVRNVVLAICLVIGEDIEFM